MKLKFFLIAVVLGCTAFSLSCSKNAALTSGKLYLGQDNLDKARDQLEMAVEQIPQDWEPHFLLGVVYAKTKKFEEMNREFETVIKLDPAKESIVNRGDRKYWTGRETMWIDYYNDGITYLNAKKYDKAAEYFGNATRIWPMKEKSFSQLGFVYSILGRNDEAIAACQKAVELAPNDAQIRMNLATTYFNLKMFPNAAEEYKKSLDLDPTNPNAWMYIAQAYEQTESFDEAIAAYQKAI
ncbi:MAG: tetratricopeptide repeat protein [Gemmatimonadota bacterium]|nr:MAG: tetratricopeptide repeat protein [Gemmatimonadota bacterium]